MPGSTRRTGSSTSATSPLLDFDRFDVGSQPIVAPVNSRGQIAFYVAGLVEGLSPVARAYFAAGGLGILIGDGQLNYRPEQILEAYYAFSLNKWATLTFDYQFVDNPGYNAVRGPVSIFTGRLHAQF